MKRKRKIFYCLIKFLRLLYELPASGGVVPQSTFRTVKLLRYVTGFDYFILTCEICFAIMILYYVVEEFIEVRFLKI
jgi:hypothetical protein